MVRAEKVPLSLTEAVRTEKEAANQSKEVHGWIYGKLRKAKKAQNRLTEANKQIASLQEELLQQTKQRNAELEAHKSEAEEWKSLYDACKFKQEEDFENWTAKETELNRKIQELEETVSQKEAETQARKVDLQAVQMQLATMSKAQEELEKDVKEKERQSQEAVALQTELFEKIAQLEAITIKKDCFLHDAAKVICRLTSGYVEAPAGPPANSYAMPPGTASAPRPAETARNLSTSLAPVASVGAVTPVSGLNAYTGGGWKIEARVLTKGDVRKFNDQHGEGQLFKVELGDKTGEISATFFGSAVDKYYTLLKPEKVYTFQKGQIKPANKSYDRGDHVLVFEEHALIEAVSEDDDIPKISYDFRDLASVETLQPETYIDVKAVIFHMQDPFTFTAKTSNEEMTKRVLHLWDTSGDPASGSTCELTLWGDTALSSEFEMNQVIFLKKARVTEFNGQKSLSSPAGMQHSPDHPQAFALIRSYQQLQQTNPQAFQTRTNYGSSAGKPQTIEELRQEDIGYIILD